ncbi:MAG: NAD(P)/FAD-dependent oxidoreductase [Qingshengfaniella sp.]
MNHHLPVLILGAGAAGLMCAAHAGPGAVVVEHNRNPGEKIRISGGGRCNFTNMYAGPENFLSANPHFAKSALSRYTQWDFLDLIARHGIAWHEKTLGQLFCDGSSKQIVALLMHEAQNAGALVWLGAKVGQIGHDGQHFTAEIDREGQRLAITADALVLASGGLSIPKMGASDLSHRVARQFGLPLVAPRPGLVPLTLDQPARDLAGLALPVRAMAGGVSFDEAALFTHRGMSGPAILQASSYWQPGQDLTLDLLPGQDAFATLRAIRGQAGGREIATVLATLLPNRLAGAIASEMALPGRLADQADPVLARLADRLNRWQIRPSGSEGYAKAEVTLGGVDTAALSSRTMEARTQPGLYVIGEAMDVTGWLGGFNFQWAWSSGWAAGQAIAAARGLAPG